MGQCGYCAAQAAAASKEAQSGNKAALQQRFEKILARSQEPPAQPKSQTVVVRGANSAIVVETAPPKKGT